jgi:hypothetical protein
MLHQRLHIGMPLFPLSWACLQHRLNPECYTLFVPHLTPPPTVCETTLNSPAVSIAVAHGNQLRRHTHRSKEAKHHLRLQRTPWPVVLLAATAAGL